MLLDDDKDESEPPLFALSLANVDSNSIADSAICFETNDGSPACG